MNALEALTALTGFKPTQGHEIQARSMKFGGLHDADTIASLPMQRDKCWTRLVIEAGEIPLPYVVHSHIALQRWDVAKDGYWSKPPQRDGRLDLSELRVAYFYADILKREWDPAGRDFWTEHLNGIGRKFEASFIAGVEPGSPDWEMLRKKGMVR